MDTPRQLPKFKFRVLIIGRANAGKTSILQRVCDTTQSPTIYRKSVRCRKNEFQLDPSMERGEHTIEDELIFSNHDGYVFHDSRGFESGDNEELTIVQNFVQRKTREKRLRNRLHAIWYCIPMDNQRPELELKYFKDICPDQNVPIIAVFTKYEQFRRNIKMHLQDHPNEVGNAADVAERRFQDHYLCPLGDGARFVRLEKMHKPGSRCDNLVEGTAGALDNDAVALMLLAVQRDNVELSVKVAVKSIRDYFVCDAEDPCIKEILKICLLPFPHLWGDHYAHIFGDTDDFARPPNIVFPDADDALECTLPQSFITKFCTASNSACHLIIAIIAIFKHATILHASGVLPKPAVAQAESAYQQLNIDSKVALYFTGHPQQYSVQQVTDFIMGICLDI